LVLTVGDPDAPDPAHPRTTWYHWILFDIPPTTSGLAKGIAASALPPGTKEGLNDWKSTGWRGPCPPVGRHRYQLRLFALDTTLARLDRPTQRTLTEAMDHHVLGQAELVGTYEKTK